MTRAIATGILAFVGLTCPCYIKTDEEPKKTMELFTVDIRSGLLFRFLIRQGMRMDSVMYFLCGFANRYSLHGGV